MTSRTNMRTRQGGFHAFSYNVSKPIHGFRDPEAPQHALRSGKRSHSSNEMHGDYGGEVKRMKLDDGANVEVLKANAMGRWDSAGINAGAESINTGGRIGHAIRGQYGAGDDVALSNGSTLESGVFVNLASEIHLEIIEHLPDSDAARYACLSKTLYTIVGDNVWHDRFIQSFDGSELNAQQNQVDVLARKYKYRQMFLRKAWDIRKHIQERNALSKEDLCCKQRNEDECMQMLRSLIIDSDAKLILDEEGKPLKIVSLNQERIADFCHPDRLNIIQEIFDCRAEWCSGMGINGRSPRNLIMVLYLCLAQVALRPDAYTDCRRFDESQRYMYVEHGTKTMFLGRQKQDLNIRWLIHAVNFWRLHLTSPHEGVLHHAFSDLPRNQLPQPWLGRLKTGTQRLGKTWKGAYLSLSNNDLDARRMYHDQVYTDELDLGETFQDFTFCFDEHNLSASNWPAHFESVLQGNPFDKAAVKIEYFYGVSRSRGRSGTSSFFGCLHAMPVQQGISGFMRVTLLQFMPYAQSGGYDLWGYEGCVLPGARIIIGQWWFVADGNYSKPSGPFILWNLDNDHVPELDGEVAMKLFSAEVRPNGI